MPKAIKTCRVCGKQYEACRTARLSTDNVFRWQDVACSPECGAAYFDRVMKARAANAQPAPGDRGE